MPRDSVYTAATAASKAAIGYEQEKWDIAESLSEVEFAGQKAAYQREKWGRLESTVADALEVVSTLGGMMEDQEIFEDVYLPEAQETLAREAYEGKLPWEKFKGKKDLYSAYLSEFAPQKVDRPWWDVLGETEYKFGEKGGTYSKGIISATGRHRKGAADVSALLGEDVPYTTAADILETDEPTMIEEVDKNINKQVEGKDTDFEKLKKEARQKQLDRERKAMKELEKKQAKAAAEKLAAEKAAAEKAAKEAADFDPSGSKNYLAEDAEEAAGGGQGALLPVVETDKPDKMAEMMKIYKEQDLNPSVTGGTEVDWFDPARAGEFGWVGGRWI